MRTTVSWFAWCADLSGLCHDLKLQVLTSPMAHANLWSHAPGMTTHSGQPTVSASTAPEHPCEEGYAVSMSDRQGPLHQHLKPLNPSSCGVL